MSAYRVFYSEQAQKLLREVTPKQVQDRIRARIRGLADNPRPPGAEALHGELAGLMRIRQGRYRVAYQVDDRERTVRIWTIGPRGNVYKRL